MVQLEESQSGYLRPVCVVSFALHSVVLPPAQCNPASYLERRGGGIVLDGSARWKDKRKATCSPWEDGSQRLTGGLLDALKTHMNFNDSLHYSCKWQGKEL